MARIISPVTTCSFAASGTYGHECGKPATQVAVKKSTGDACHPPPRTASGFYLAGRCDECAAIRGGENAGVLRFEPLNGHVNEWV